MRTSALGCSAKKKLHETYLEVQGITTWTFSVAAGKGSAGPSRLGVSCRDRKIMIVALASSPGEAWA